MAKQPRILAGETAAITGAARGIGRATAEAFLRQGMRVAIGDVDLEAASQTASELGASTVALPLDVTDRDSFSAFLDGAEEQLGPLDVLVNNAGIMQIGRFIDEDDLTARRMVDINLHGVILGMKLALDAHDPARPRPHRQHLLAGGQVRRARRRDLLGDQARRRRPDRGRPRRAAPDGRPHRRQLRDAVRGQHRARRRPRARRAGCTTSSRAKWPTRSSRRSSTGSSTCGCRSPPSGRTCSRRMLPRSLVGGHGARDEGRPGAAGADTNRRRDYELRAARSEPGLEPAPSGPGSSAPRRQPGLEPGPEQPQTFRPQRLIAPPGGAGRPRRGVAPGRIRRR